MPSKITTLALATCGLLAVALPAQAQDAGTPAAGKTAEPATVVDVLKANRDHALLVAVAAKLELVPALTGAGPITVFAPTDAAFNALPPGSLDNFDEGFDARPYLTEIVTGHVVAGAWTAEKLKGTRELKTLAGTTLEIDADDKGVRVNGVPVTGTTKAGNGLVHAVGHLIMPIRPLPAKPDSANCVFPKVEAESLTGKTFALPGDLEKTYDIVVLAFHSIQHRSVETWVPFLKEIESSRSDLRYYEMPVLAPMSEEEEKTVAEGMRRGIPDEATRARTISIHRDPETLLGQAGLPRTLDRIHVLLVTPDGKIHWRAEGPLSRAAQTSLKAFLKQLDGADETTED